jgi:hypothetical protein
MVIRMKSKPVEMIEGSTALKRFNTAMKTIIAVPHSEIVRREEEYKRQSNLNPRKRGPKPKRTTASPGPGDDV